MTQTPDENHTPGNEAWRPARETKAQRQWQPGQTQKPRSILKVFTATVLWGEAFVIAFFGLMLYGFHQDDGGLWMLFGALAIAIIAGYSARHLPKPPAMTVGWIIQVLLIASGFLEPFGFFVGAAFAVAWCYAVFKGRQIDQENVQRAKEQEAWEREHGPEADTDWV